MVYQADIHRIIGDAHHVPARTSKSYVAGIACMSVCLPFTNDCVARSGKRWMFNIVGGLLFVVLYTVLPESMYAYIGIIGGIGVGYSAGYSADSVQYIWSVSMSSGLVWNVHMQ